MSRRRSTPPRLSGREKQDGDRLQHAAEQQDQHGEDHHQACAHGEREAFEHFGHDLGIAAFLQLDAGGQVLGLGQVEDGLHGGAQRETLGEVGAHDDAAHAIVALDAGRALAEAELGDGEQRDGEAGGALDGEGLHGAEVAAHGLLDLDADRDQAVAVAELGEVRVDVADGGDADGVADRFG